MLSRSQSLRSSVERWKQHGKKRRSSEYEQYPKGVPPGRIRQLISKYQDDPAPLVEEGVVFNTRF